MPSVFLVFLYFYYWCFLPSFTPTYIGTMSVSHKSTDFETILQSDMRSPCWSPSDFSSQNWSVPLLLIGCWATDHLPLGAKAFTHQQWAVHYRVIISTGHQWRSARAYWLDQSKPSRAGATGWSWWNYFGPIPPQVWCAMFLTCVASSRNQATISAATTTTPVRVDDATTDDLAVAIAV